MVAWRASATRAWTRRPRTAALAAWLATLAPAGCGDDDDEEDGARDGGAGAAAPLAEAKLNIEHNATDQDTGFQGFLDGEGWERLEVRGPGGVVLEFAARGPLAELGLTELFFETVEPENADVPLEDVLATLPAGDYTIEGTTVDGGVTRGTARLTHDIPAGPVLLGPPAGATVAADRVVVRWEPVTRTLTGAAATIVAYQVIVERDQEPHPDALAQRVFSVHLPPAVTSVTVPPEFLEPGTSYEWEVLAIEDSGNQTISSSEFVTAEGPDHGPMP